MPPFFPLKLVEFYHGCAPRCVEESLWLRYLPSPAGNLTIDSENALSDDGYTSTATVTLNLSMNDYVSGYYLLQTDISGVSIEDLSEGGWRDDSITSISGYALDSSSQGTKTVQVIFRYASSGSYLYSTLRSASIIYDSQLPAVNAGSDIMTNTVVTTNPSVSDANLKSAAWATVSGSEVIFRSPSVKIRR